MHGICAVTGRHTGTRLLDLRDRLGLNDGPLSLWCLTDDGLARIRRQHARAAEDYAIDRSEKRARRERYMDEEARSNQHMRFRLRMRYGAVDDHIGTASYDCWMRHDEAPGYALALFMDHARARLGRPHVLTWPDVKAAA